MQGDLRARSARRCGRAGATLAVSEAIAGELRAAGIPRVEVIPNIVDARGGARAGRAAAVVRAARALPAVRRQARGEQGRARCWCPRWPPPRTGPAAGRAGRGHARARAEVRGGRGGRRPRSCAAGPSARTCCARWRAPTALVFPSLWPEPLSRVLLEALALGTPVAAMDTGGTREILRRRRAGCWCRDARRAGRGAWRRLVGDAGAARRAARRRRARAPRPFAPEALVPRYEAVYRRLA